MPIAGSTSPSWSNEDADDFWDDDLGALNDDDLVPLNSTDMAGPNADVISKTEAVTHENGETPRDHMLADYNGCVSRETPSKLDKVAGAEDNSADSLVEQKRKSEVDPNMHKKTVPNPTLVTKDVSIPHDTESGKIAAEVPEKTEFPSGAIAHHNRLELDQESGNMRNHGNMNSFVSKRKLSHDSSNKTEVTNDVSRADTVRVPPQPIIAPSQSETVPAPARMTAEDLENESSKVFEPQPGHNQTMVSENNHFVRLKSNGPENSPKHIESSETSTKSVTIATQNEKDASVKSPQAESVQNPEVIELTTQISVLKLELEEKDAKLSQIEKEHSDSYNKSDKSSAAEEIHRLEESLQKTEKERDQAQAQLEGFLSKISSMKTVFQNFKATQMELEEVKQELEQANEEREKAIDEKRQIVSRILEFEIKHQKYSEEKEAWNTESKKYLAVIESLKTEALDLNSECDRLSQLMGTLRREFQSKEESLQDEKYTLENEVSRLNKKLSEQRTTQSDLELEKEEAIIDNKNLALSMQELKERLEAKESELTTLQAALTDTQKLLQSRIDELESSLKGKNDEIASAQAKLEQLQTEIASIKIESEEKTTEIENLQKDKERIKSLEEEVHSKQLIIGKLRHEAIILNEHLTKSISMLKQQSGDTNKTVDRELVSNMILNFLQIPRGDTKKFEALSLIAGLLDWDDAKKIQAGLMHGARTDENKPQRSGIISLWTDFLDKESSKK